MFHNLEVFDTYVEKIPIGLKKKYVFYKLPYRKCLKIVDLLDLVYIFKNILSSIWRHISLKKGDKLDIR
jgi:hypothetical protein